LAPVRSDQHGVHRNVNVANFQYAGSAIPPAADLPLGLVCMVTGEFLSFKVINWIHVIDSVGYRDSQPALVAGDALDLDTVLAIGRREASSRFSASTRPQRNRQPVRYRDRLPAAH